MANFKINKKLLIEQHLKQKKSCVSIAKEFGFTPTGVRRALLRYNIKYTREKTGSISKDRANEIYGTYTVLSYEGKNPCNHTIWKCQCNKCGTIRNMGIGGLNRSKKEERGCQNCRIKSYGEIHSRYYNNLKNKAKHRKIKWKVKPDYLWNLFLLQKRKCAFTGIELVFAKNYRNNKEQTASLDRIDSNKGYEIGNVQWVYIPINFMKQALTDENFIDLCKKVVHYTNTK
jgi:hypothetical protein